MPSHRFIAALLALLSVPAAFAAELKLLSAGAVEPGLRAAVARYERDTGDKVAITFATAPVLRDRATGESWVLDMWPRAYAQLPDVMTVARWMKED